MKPGSWIGGASVAVLLTPAVPAQGVMAAPQEAVGWMEHRPATKPSLRWAHAMAYDASRRQVVLFGGAYADQNTIRFLGDTWTWDGSDWIQRSPKTSPPNRSFHAMAYDAARQRVVLFGGATGGSFNDTWEWDGSNWTQRTAATSPPTLQGHAMAFDGARNRVVLFGADDTTWEWDGDNWTPRRPATRPSARTYVGMAYDAGRQRTVLFGGLETRPGGRVVNDTWEWDGDNWTLHSHVTSPPKEVGHALAYDVARRRVVHFGGASDDSVWEWDGSNWTRASLNTGRPLGRNFYGVAYHDGREAVVFFGGYGDDTWEYGRLPLFGQFGAACLGSASRPSLDVQDPPRIGQRFSLRLTQAPPHQMGGMFLGFSRDFWGPIPLPLDLTRIGLPGCSLLTDVILAFPIHDTGATGSVVWETTLVNNPAHVGVSFFNQAFFLDPAANPGGLVFTNAGHGVIGR